MSDIVLQFENVAASYNGAIAALHGISLTLRAGEFAALLGANGAGKTTLLKAASNLLPAERGRITEGSVPEVLAQAEVYAAAVCSNR